MNVYQHGDTIRLKCIFHDFDNKRINPELVKVTIYNYKYQIISESVVENSGLVGEYMYDYVTDNKSQRIYYEWKGEINGKPSIKRGEFMTEFI